MICSQLQNLVCIFDYIDSLMTGSILTQPCLPHLVQNELIVVQLFGVVASNLIVIAI